MTLDRRPLLGSPFSPQVVSSRVFGEEPTRKVLNGIREDAEKRQSAISHAPLTEEQRRQLKEARRITLRYLVTQYKYQEDRGQRLRGQYAKPINDTRRGDSHHGIAIVYVFPDTTLLDHAIVETHELDHTAHTFWEKKQVGLLQQFVGYHDLQTREGGLIEDCLATYTSTRVAEEHKGARLFADEFEDRRKSLQFHLQQQETNTLARQFFLLASPTDALEALMVAKEQAGVLTYELASWRYEEYFVIKRLARAIGQYSFGFQGKIATTEAAMEEGMRLLQRYRSPKRGEMKKIMYAMFTEAFGEEKGKAYADAIWMSDQDPHSYAPIIDALTAIETHQGFALN